MTRTSRSAIPGRAYADDRPSGRDLDRLVFGSEARQDPAREAAIREADARADREFAERSSPPRRKAPRKKSEYSRLPDEADGYRPVEDNKRGPLILALAIAIVGVFAAVVWNAYREGVRPLDGIAAPQLASAGAFKSRPEPAVGEAADSESVEASVFERVETGASPAQTPVEDIEPVLEVRPETPAPAPVETTVDVPVVADPVVAAPAAAKPAPVQVAAPKPAAPVAAPPTLAGGYKPAFSAGGAFVVQLAAPSTEAGALAEWEKRKKAMPELFGSAERLVVRADVNGKTVYRVRAGSFASAADADAFCGAIKGKGGDCYRTAR